MALEAALLSVTLALQAEIQSEGETVTADVQASSLDRLKVTLVSPNVSGARDLVASGNATIEGNEIAVSLENLAFGTHRLVVSARFGTQIRTLYALDISVPQAELPNETQEYEDAAIVVSTYGDGGGGEFPTDYAKQGDDPTATLTDTQAYAQAAAEAAQSLIAVDADIFAGKQALAANISAKGVPTSISDALTVMATKVLQIPQQVNAGVSEFEQMITPSPYMWNVYGVANDLMKQTLPAYIPSYMAGGNYAQYRANNAFFVGEYYLGYASLELEGADGYLTCDGDFYTITDEVGSRIVTHTAPDGTVETYAAESIIHTWHDGESGRINRWVAFFYLTNAYSYTNIKSWLCPRRVATCGDCLLFSVSGENRLTEVWNIGTIRSFYGGTDGDSWSNTQAIRIDSVNNVAFTDPKYIQFLVAQFTSISSSVIEFKNTIKSALYSVAIICHEITGGDVIYVNNVATEVTRPLKDLQYVYITAVSLSGNSTVLNSKHYYLGGIDCKIINAPYLEEIESGSAIVREIVYGEGTGESSNNEVINLPSLKRCLGNIWEKNQYRYGRCANTIDVVVGAMETNFYCRFWNPSNVLADADKTAQLIDNIKNHILARVSDATGGTQLVFTVSTDMYNAIASETITWQDQTMTLADAFLTKNWLLAGA